MRHRTRRFDVVAFDLEGTLVDSASDVAAAVNAVLRAFGRAPLAERKIASFIGQGVERLVKRSLDAAAHHDRRAIPLGDAVRLFQDAYAPRLHARGSAYLGAAEALQELKDQGIATCCVTSTNSLFAIPLLEAAGLADLLAFALCDDESTQRKPSPALLRSAADRCGVPIHEVLHVADSIQDIRAAHAAGCSVAVVDYGYSHPSDLMRGLPDWIIGSLGEVVAIVEETPGIASDELHL